MVIQSSGGGSKGPVSASSPIYKIVKQRDQETELANTFRRMEAIRRQEQRIYQEKVASELAARAGRALGLPKSRDTKLFKKEYCREYGMLGVIDENDF